MLLNEKDIMLFTNDGGHFEYLIIWGDLGSSHHGPLSNINVYDKLYLWTKFHASTHQIHHFMLLNVKDITLFNIHGGHLEYLIIHG